MQEEERNAIIENFQRVLPDVRKALHWTAVQLAKMMDVTRQTISNLESGKTKMTRVQYLALAALVDFATRDSETVRAEVLRIVDDANEGFRDAPSLSYDSLLARVLEGLVNEAQEATPGDLLARLAEETKIFLDSDVLFSPDAPEFFPRLATALQDAGAQAILPRRVAEAINDAEPSPSRSSAITIVNQMRQAGVLTIRGEAADPDIHDTIRSVFLRFRSRFPLCLLTQDAAFAQDVLRMNDDRTLGKGHPVEVYRLQNGGLQPHAQSEIRLKEEDDADESWDALEIEAEETPLAREEAEKLVPSMGGEAWSEL